MRRSSATVAVAQLRIEECATDANTERCHAALGAAVDAGADLLVLPECALTGYRYSTRDEAVGAALTIHDPRISRLAQEASAGGVTVVLGLLERAGDALHNTAALFHVDGRAHYTRKTHLPVLGADRFVLPGDRIGPVVETPSGRIGVAICYDFRFPEVCRSLSLRGADVVAVPVNWSSDVAVLAEHVVPTRAVENRVYVAVADRAGAVDGVEHLGASQIVDPTGTRLTDALDPSREVAIAVAAVDLAAARTKATVFEPGVFEIDVFAHRRPELYEVLTNEEKTDDA
jgi:predicted amidohydrolase